MRSCSRPAAITSTSRSVAARPLREMTQIAPFGRICGRSDTTYPQRVMMDMHYIDHRSLSLDLWLMLFTIAAVVRKSGAC